MVDGTFIDYELSSPFVYLGSLVERLSSPGNGKGGSKQISEGAQETAERRFLFNGTGVRIEGTVTNQNSENEKELMAGLRFEQRGKLDMDPMVHGNVQQRADTPFYV